MNNITRVIDLNLLKYEPSFILVTITTIIIITITLILVKKEIKKGSKK